MSQKEQFTVDPFEEAPILEQMLQGQIQEVRHRFAIERHLHARRKTHESGAGGTALKASATAVL